MGREMSMSKRSARFLASWKIDLAAQAAEEANQLPAGHVLIKPQFARQIGDMPAGVETLVPAIESPE